MFDETFKDVDIRGSWSHSMHLWRRVIGLSAAGAIPEKAVVTRNIRPEEAVEQGFRKQLWSEPI